MAKTNPEPKLVESRETSRPVNITAAAILSSVILHLRTIRTSQFPADEPDKNIYDHEMLMMSHMIAPIFEGSSEHTFVSRRLHGA
jgi:hypothetical protein